MHKTARKDVYASPDTGSTDALLFPVEPHLDTQGGGSGFVVDRLSTREA